MTKLAHEWKRNAGNLLAPDIEQMIAQRITHCAKNGERDHDKLLAAALQGLVAEEFSLSQAIAELIWGF